MNWELTTAIAVGGALAYYAGRWMDTGTRFAIAQWDARHKRKVQAAEMRIARARYAEEVARLDADNQIRKAVDDAIHVDTDEGYTQLGRLITRSMFGLAAAMFEDHDLMELGLEVADKVREIDDMGFVRSVEDLLSGGADA